MYYSNSLNISQCLTLGKWKRKTSKSSALTARYSLHTYILYTTPSSTTTNSFTHINFFPKKTMYSDVRYIVLVAINLMKTGMPWDWDPFEAISQPTWIKAWFLFFLFFVFSFTSIKFLLTTTTPSEHNNTTKVVVKFGEFDPHLAVALMLGIVFPQVLFWYALFFVLVFSFCSEWFLNFLRCFNNCLMSLLSTIPIFIVVIRATAAGFRTEANARWYLRRRSLDDGGVLLESSEDGQV